MENTICSTKLLGMSRKRKFSSSNDVAPTDSESVSKFNKITNHTNQTEYTCPIDQCSIPLGHEIGLSTGGVTHIYNTLNILKHMEEDSTLRDPLTRIKYTNEQIQAVRNLAKTLGETVCHQTQKKKQNLV